MAKNPKGKSKTIKQKKQKTKEQPEEDIKDPYIFLSHRHKDSIIADVLRKNLLSWGMPSSSIFQSSHPESGPAYTKKLKDELKTALVQANLVILIYTFADEDWSYCMWETGVAVNPESDDTNIIVFKCTDDTSKVFKDQTLVDMSEKSITKFVKQFHTYENFFQASPAYAPDIDPSVINDRSKTLYKGLTKVVPCGKFVERYRWDNFRLELDKETVQMINNETNEDSIISLIQEKCIIKDKPPPFGQSLKHFGFSAFFEGMTLKELIERWKDGKNENTKKGIKGWKETSEEWIDELCFEIKRAINIQDAQPPSALLRSLVPDTDWWFYPVLNHVRVLTGNDMEFDIYFFRKS